MSTYDEVTRHLCICRSRGAGLRKLDNVSKVFLRDESWQAGYVTMHFCTFPVRVRHCRDPEYPLAFRPLKLVRGSEFHHFFDFATGDSYDPDRVVAANAATFSCGTACEAEQRARASMENS